MFALLCANIVNIYSLEYIYAHVGVDNMCTFIQQY